MKKLTCIFLLLTLLAGCARLPQQVLPGQSQPASSQSSVPSVTPQVSVEELFSQRDYKTDYDRHATITLSGTGVSCDSDAVRIDGTTVTITDEGTYVLTGTLDDGMIIVDADKEDKTQLVLADASIHSAACAPIYIRQADKVFITLAEGSRNTLSAGESFTSPDDNNIDAVIWSKEDLTLNGTGALQISAPAGHGVVSKDALTVTGGSYSVTTAAHGFAGKDSVAIDGTQMTLATGKDGIHSENSDDATLGYLYIKSGTFDITAEGDGISAAAWLQLDGGSYSITTGGGSQNGSKQTSDNWGGFGGGKGGMGGMTKPGRPGGMTRPTGSFQPTGMQPAAQDTTDSTSIKGIKAGTALTVCAGDFILNTADDGLHSNGSMEILGGSFRIATGDDGIHAEETLTVKAGTVNITESYEGLEALHISMEGGEVTLVASDDGLNAAGGNDQSGMGGRDQFGGGRGGFGGGMSSGNGSIVISGGKLAVTASGDGIDSNGTLEITGGYTTVCGPTRGDTATLDYDRTATVTGGTFIGTGAAGMAQTFSQSEQGIISLRTQQAAGTAIRVTDSAGKEIISHTPQLEYAVVILSSPELQKGQTYTVQIGSTSQQTSAK